tara:strand:- start:140 stop:739 length:600 start_codon:yes stop_codon:yes gene_type:complete
MALTKTESLALAGFGINEALLKGQGVGARTLKALGKAAVKLTPYVAPPVARGAVGVGRAALGGAATFARRNPAVATGLSALALQQAGAFDPVEEEIRARVDDAVQRAMAPVQLAQTDIAKQAAKSVVKRKVSKYSRAVKAGMAAVKKSKFSGKPGKITNAKKAFATVNKVASAVNKGKKVAKTGIRGVAARAIKGILRK